jgi:hypothetical protein
VHVPHTSIHRGSFCSMSPTPHPRDGESATYVRAGAKNKAPLHNEGYSPILHISASLRPTPADSLSLSLFSTANSFSLLSVSVPVSSRLRICTPHAVYNSCGPRAAASACSLVRRGVRNRGKGECRYTACVLRRRMRRLLESEIVT